MRAIKKEYIVTADNKKRAVLVDIKTFNKMEELLENYGLVKYMEEIEHEEALHLDAAKRHYRRLTKG